MGLPVSIPWTKNIYIFFVFFGWSFFFVEDYVSAVLSSKLQSVKLVFFLFCQLVQSVFVDIWFELDWFAIFFGLLSLLILFLYISLAFMKLDFCLSFTRSVRIYIFLFRFYLWACIAGFCEFDLFFSSFQGFLFLNLGFYFSFSP